MKAATSIISKIQYQYDVINETSQYFVYPRPGKHDISNKRSSQENTVLPTKVEIVNEILKCKRNAIESKETWFGRR